MTVTGATTYTKTVTATSSAIKVGLCASAFGTADDTGAITAKQIQLSAPTNGTCSARLGGGFGGFPRGGAPGSAGGQSGPVTTNG